MNRDEEILSKLAYEYVIKHESELHGILPWKRILSLFALGFMLSVFTMGQNEIIQTMTDRIGILLMGYSLGVLQDGNSFFRRSFRITWVMMGTRMILPFLSLAGIGWYEPGILVWEIILYSLLIFWMSKGICCLSEGTQWRRSILRSTDGFWWSYIYLMVIPFLAVLCNNAEFVKINKNFIVIGWILLELLILIWFCWNICMIGNKISLIGYGICLLPICRRTKLKCILAVVTGLEFVIYLGVLKIWGGG